MGGWVCRGGGPYSESSGFCYCFSVLWPLIPKSGFVRFKDANFTIQSTPSERALSFFFSFHFFWALRTTSFLLRNRTDFTYLSVPVFVSLTTKVGQLPYRSVDFNLVHSNLASQAFFHVVINPKLLIIEQLLLLIIFFIFFKGFIRWSSSAHPWLL